MANIDSALLHAPVNEFTVRPAYLRLTTWPNAGNRHGPEPIRNQSQVPIFPRNCFSPPTNGAARCPGASPRAGPAGQLAGCPTPLLATRAPIGQGRFRRDFINPDNRISLVRAQRGEARRGASWWSIAMPFHPCRVDEQESFRRPHRKGRRVQGPEAGVGRFRGGERIGPVVVTFVWAWRRSCWTRQWRRWLVVQGRF